nr:hypothetical protein [Apis mellifera nudivirus]
MHDYSSLLVSIIHSAIFVRFRSNMAAAAANDNCSVGHVRSLSFDSVQYGFQYGFQYGSNGRRWLLYVHFLCSTVSQHGWQFSTPNAYPILYQTPVFQGNSEAVGAAACNSRAKEEWGLARGVIYSLLIGSR